MEAPISNGLKYDNEEQALKSLLDAFGSVFSLKEIASAYCDAGKNADLAGEILYDLQGSASTSPAYASNGEARSEESSESSYSHLSESSCHANGKLRASKQKCRPVSVSGGTVSSVLGKHYVKPMPPTNGSCIATKPVKLDSSEFPMSELWGEGANPNPSKDDCMHKDMEEFLFKMLGHGFQLSRDVIREVLDNCGYNMQKSMEKLLDQSAETLDRRNKSSGKSAEKFTDACPDSVGPSCQRKLQPMNSPGDSGNRVSYTNGEELSGQQKERNDLQAEVLAALFNGPERYEESTRREVNVRRSEAFGQVVFEPPKDFAVEHKAVVIPSHQDIEDKDEDDEDGEGSYQALRRAVKENRGTMKEYYKAAAEAFAKGDHVRASKLLEQGQVFYQKARSADEESNLKIFETGNVETQDKMLLDLHDHGAKEAIRLLKCHLSSLSGIPSFKYLEVIIETNDEDISKGARRRLIMKLLDKESIEWIEEGNAGTILIRLDNINRKRLSFAKK